MHSIGLCDSQNTQALVQDILELGLVPLLVGAILKQKAGKEQRNRGNALRIICVMLSTVLTINEFVDAGIISNAIRLVHDSRTVESSLEILCFIPERLNQEHVSLVVGAGGIPTLSAFVLSCYASIADTNKALAALSYIAQFSFEYRDKILHSKLVLKSDVYSLSSKQHCLFFLYPMGIAGKNKQLADKIVNSGVIPLLVDTSSFFMTPCWETKVSKHTLWEFWSRSYKRSSSPLLQMKWSKLASYPNSYLSLSTMHVLTTIVLQSSKVLLPCCV
jgi:hypothetical protein